MAAEKIDITKLSDTEIAQMFSDYVGRMEDKERHTEAACKEVDTFDLCCSSEFPNNVRVQNLMYEKMMDSAIEFEESGFIAGFKTAMALLSGQEELLPAPTNIPLPEQEKRGQEAVNALCDEGTNGYKKEPAIEANFLMSKEFINTKQIADMFETTNFKVVRRIEQQILPYCDNETKSFFEKVEGHNIQHKRTVFYKLNKTACLLYLKELEPKKKNYINIAGGCAKMIELIERMFPSEVRAIPA